jgi:hypothetical protein
MMSSRPFDNRSPKHHFRCSVTGNAAARNTVLDSTRRVAPILAPAVQSATAPSRLHLKLPTNQLLWLHRETLLHSQAVAKSP